MNGGWPLKTFSRTGIQWQPDLWKHEPGKCNSQRGSENRIQVFRRPKSISPDLQKKL